MTGVPAVLAYVALSEDCATRRRLSRNREIRIDVSLT